MPHTGSSASAARRRAAARLARARSSPAARSCTSSARIATAISRCDVWPRSSPTGTRTRSSRCAARRGRRGSRAPPRRACGRRPDRRRPANADTARSTASSSPWPWVATTTTERVDVGRGEVRRRRARRPASRAPGPGRPACGPSASARRRPGAGGTDRLDVDLHGALALAGDRDDHHPVRHAAPNCRPCPSSSSRGSPSAITRWPRGSPPARRRRRRSSRGAARPR